ncbi:hypothetical protein CROQUDRAFT_430674 [Cronartium quercuum f. sp. fusiforme G11]|uniref:Uncharacterized protein n=1 Tax=Cronartium quercuum f. sp. fusiforme G11 TaxID=708437 RepID=A0A9P6NM84_9BASI|nr:hypothetical protein CROQUDRAFT_430674 [Cronartium quercuum f. sp. fusiforme G11]
MIFYHSLDPSYMCSSAISYFRIYFFAVKYRMLEDLDEHIDRTESRLSKANKKLNRFVHENKNSKSTCLFSTPNLSSSSPNFNPTKPLLFILLSSHLELAFQLFLSKLSVIVLFYFYLFAPLRCGFLHFVGFVFISSSSWALFLFSLFLSVSLS